MGFEPTTPRVKDLRYDHLAKRDMTIAGEKNVISLCYFFNSHLDVKCRNDLNEKAFNLKEFNLASMAVLTDLF